MFIKYILSIIFISILIALNTPQAINTINIAKLDITVYSNGSYDLEAVINTTKHFNYTLTLYGKYVYNKIFEVRALQKPSYYNGRYNLIFLFKRKNSGIYNGSIYEENTYNSSFYIRRASYLIKYVPKYVNVSRLSLKIITNNIRYIIYWNLTITALRLIAIGGEMNIKYYRSNNNYTLHIVMTKSIFPQDESVKKQLAKIMFPGENYLSPWIIMERTNLISYNVSADHEKLLLNIRYSFKGLGLIIEKDKYMIPLAIILGSNGFEIIKMLIGLVNNTFYTSIVWNTTINDNRLYSVIRGRGYGLSIDNMDRVRSVIYMVKKLFLNNSRYIVVRGGDLLFNINGTITDQIGKVELGKINIETLQYITGTTKNTTKYTGKNSFPLILYGISILGLILSFILYKILQHRIRSRTS